MIKSLLFDIEYAKVLQKIFAAAVAFRFDIVPWANFFVQNVKHLVSVCYI